MRRRVKRLDGKGVYHCISRVVWQEFALEDQAKEVFRKMMEKVSVFCGVEILTFCLMTNHVHLLVRISGLEWEKGGFKELEDAELVRRVRVLYGAGSMRAKGFEDQLKDPSMRDAARKRLLARMHDVSGFMKELKQRFSIWFNAKYGKAGTMWSERFRSVMVEERGGVQAMQMMAGYIDLNPVRAGMVRDPKDYRWCGYAEAVRGKASARKGLMWVLDARQGWREAVELYRGILFLGESGGEISRRVSDGRCKKEGKEEEPQVSSATFLRSRVRYFTDGVVLGSRGFLKEWMGSEMGEYFPKRKDDLRGAEGLRAFGVWSFRRLKRKVFGGVEEGYKAS